MVLTTISCVHNVKILNISLFSVLFLGITKPYPMRKGVKCVKRKRRVCENNSINMP